MSLTPSTMLALGTKAADFRLPDTVTGKIISLKTFEGKKGLLVMFLSRHCPYVQHVKGELAKLGKDYAGKSLGIVAISSNDVTNYPDDAPNELKRMAQEEGFLFPFCYDETQAVAKAYTAACTPDFFVFNTERTLAYRGQLDESRPGNGKPVTGRDVRTALDDLLAGKPVATNQKPSMGCNIKWKPGQEPDYFSR
jgi:peroxiredoxin